MRHPLSVVGVVVNRGGAVEPIALNENAVDRGAIGRDLPQVAFGGIVEALDERREGKRVDVAAVHRCRNVDLGEAAIAAADEERVARGVESDGPAANGKAITVDELVW